VNDAEAGARIMGRAPKRLERGPGFMAEADVEEIPTTS
jgi:hypothetical protein